MQRGQRGLSLRWGQHLNGNCVSPLFSLSFSTQQTRSCLHTPVTGKPQTCASHPKLPAAQYNGLFPWLLPPDSLYITATILARDVLAIFLLLSQADIFPSPWTYAFLTHKTIPLERLVTCLLSIGWPRHTSHSEAGLWSETFPSELHGCVTNLSIICIFFIFSYGYLKHTQFDLVWLCSCSGISVPKKAHVETTFITIIHLAKSRSLLKQTLLLGFQVL